MRIKTVATKAEAPSFEATPANFRALFCWFSEEGAKQLEHVPAIKPKAIHRPAAHPDGRRYYRKDRGCFYVKRCVPTRLRSTDPTETTSSCPTPPKASKKSSNGQTPLTFVTTKRKMGRPHKRVCAASLSPSDFFADESGSALEPSSASPSCVGSEASGCLPLHCVIRCTRCVRNEKGCVPLLCSFRCARCVRNGTSGVRC